jgi:hypothetical protein
MPVLVLFIESNHKGDKMENAVKSENTKHFCCTVRSYAF